jgi:CubicO group peptidase (beta-lactamase class C family)
VLTLFSLLACSRGASDVDSPDTPEPDPCEDLAPIEAWWALYEAELVEEAVPGAQISVLCGGDVVWSKAWGVRSLEGGEPVTPDTLFGIASMSKGIGAAAVLEAEADGLLDVHAPITDLLDTDVTQGGDVQDITLDRMMAHIAGYPDYPSTDDRRYFDCPAFEDLREIMAALGPVPLATPPTSEVYHYSNLGFSLMGAALEEAEDRPWADVIEDRIADPLGIELIWEWEQAFEAEHAVGHAFWDDLQGEPVDPADYDCQLWDAPAGAFTTAEDLALFVRELIVGGDALRPDTIATMTAARVGTRTSPTDTYGYGEFGFERNGVRLVGHDGRYFGYTGAYIAAPDEGFGVVILTNASEYSAGGAALRAADAILGLDGADPAVVTDPSTWTAYVGTYLDPIEGGYGRQIVTLEGDRLYVEFPDADPAFRTELVQRSGDAFWFDVQGATYPMVFWREEPDADARWFVFRYFSGERTDGARARPAPARGRFDPRLAPTDFELGR